MADFIPKLRIPALLTGVVTSDSFPAMFKRKDGDNFVDDCAGWVFNVEIPVENAPPISVQLQTLDKATKGDNIQFPMKLETSLRTKYSIKDKIVLIDGKKAKAN